MINVGSFTGTSPIHSTLTGPGAVPVGKIGSVIIIRCVTLIVFPHTSVTLNVLVIFSGHDKPSDTSVTNATVGVEQLSASS